MRMTRAEYAVDPVTITIEAGPGEIVPIIKATAVQAMEWTDEAGQPVRVTIEAPVEVIT
ncbi:hypothetical protein [Paracoccus fontiphilus]|uniref:Uncharacterized protein n=1 Tax=Paracoccus fontiphilus TaxID=1815556 RepID=A0ABV7IIL1_9RHOB|nr:hypothetical protein [Paracoccus fontiphilus]